MKLTKIERITPLYRARHNIPEGTEGVTVEMEGETDRFREIKLSFMLFNVSEDDRVMLDEVLGALPEALRNSAALIEGR